MERALKTDALVIGAGPAGAAAAIVLSRLGIRVVLVDRLEFPRNKVCGDALIPDSLGALTRLGLHGVVRDTARTLPNLRVYAPDGSSVNLRGQFACQPRKSFDKLLQESAVNAGGTFLAPFRVVEPILRGKRVVGARFSHTRTGRPLLVEARVTFLATGASAQPLEIFDVCDRRAPSAIAVRSYFKIPPGLAEELDHLCISYDQSICPGYGWIFPGPDDVVNMGVGIFFDDRTTPSTTNIRDIWSAFTARFSPARRLMEYATELGPLKGAPLRTGMTGSRLHRPGLLVLGDAAGLTFPFSGEGIGKAMESGMLAAELAAACLTADNGELNDLGPEYEACLASRHRDLFDAYAAVQTWLSYPTVCNQLAKQARNNTFVRRQLEGILTETVDPRTALRPSTLFKFVTG